MIIQIISKFLAKKLSLYCSLCDTPIRKTESYAGKRYKYTKIARRLCITCIGGIFYEYRHSIPEYIVKPLLEEAISSYKEEAERWDTLQTNYRDQQKENDEWWKEWYKND